MRAKSLLSLFVAAVMLLSLGAFQVFAETTADTDTVDQQLNLIWSKISDLRQNDSPNRWYYTVTDFDHDGRLEFVAASQHPADRSTNLKIWEVSDDGTSLTENALDKDPDESFPDIITDSADTYHNTDSDTWSYMVYDNVVISNSDVYTLKCAVSLKDGAMGYQSFAVQHTQVDKGYSNVSHTDANGIAISPEQYNAAGTNAFAGEERSSTNFDWFIFEDATSVTRLVDSYSVFAGTKAPTQIIPVPKPAALQASETAPTPTPSAAPKQSQNSQPTYLTITKNPTSETKKPGGTALFVACANAFDSLYWTMVAPDGGEYSPEVFASYFGVSVSGQNSTTLSIGNVKDSINYWGAYCTFYYKGQTAKTSTAYIIVDTRTAPQPSAQGGVDYGTVTDYGFSTVTISLSGKTGVVVPFSICDVDGNLYYGASAAVYYTGASSADKGNVYYVFIQGEKQATPTYGSMSGVAYQDTASTVYVVLQNGEGYHVSGGCVNIIGGNDINGAPCTAYYLNYPSNTNIYQIDIYGYSTDPEPYYEPYIEPDIVGILPYIDEYDYDLLWDLDLYDEFYDPYEDDELDDELLWDLLLSDDY